MLFFPMDPVYLTIMLIGIPLVWLPQLWVKNTFKRVSQLPTRGQMTGLQVATDMLKRNGITDVEVEPTQSFLGDHYSPQEKKVRLSPDVYNGKSIAAAAIAAHEIGHAIQHNTGYYPVTLRGQMFPAVQLGSQFGPLLLMASFLLSFTMKGMSDFAFIIGIVGVILFSLSSLFHIVTLPVEIDASKRALAFLNTTNYLSREEMPHAKKVLTTAAFTYVATALYSLLELAGYIYRLLVLNRSRD